MLLCRRSPTTRQLHQRISRIDSLSLSLKLDREREGKNKIEKGDSNVVSRFSQHIYIGAAYLDRRPGKSIMRTEPGLSLSALSCGYVRKLFEGGRQRRTNSSRRECGLEWELLAVSLSHAQVSHFQTLQQEKLANMLLAPNKFSASPPELNSIYRWLFFWRHSVWLAASRQRETENMSALLHQLSSKIWPPNNLYSTIWIRPRHFSSLAQMYTSYITWRTYDHFV